MPLTPGSLSCPDDEGDRVLVGLDGKCRWLYKDGTVGLCTWEPSSPIPGLDIPGLDIPGLDITGLSETQCKALILSWPAPGSAQALLDSLRRHATWTTPAGEPGFWQATPRLGTSGPVWEESEDPVGAPPHYKLPGDREALEDLRKAREYLDRAIQRMDAGA